MYASQLRRNLYDPFFAGAPPFTRHSISATGHKEAGKIFCLAYSFCQPSSAGGRYPPVINTEFLFLFTSSKGKRTILRLYIYSFILCQPELFPDEKEVVSLLGQQLFPTKELKENFETWTERERERDYIHFRI